MIYFDHAATSFPKPRSVVDAVTRCMVREGGNPGRGSHSLSMAAAERVYRCRTAAAELLGVGDPQRIIFTKNTTEGLNLVLKGLLRQGDHVLISDMEHNAVYRPIACLAEKGVIDYGLFPTLGEAGEGREAAILEALSRRIRPETRMVACAYSSNICSLSLPIAAIGAFCRDRGLLFVVDGAQAAGHLPIEVDRWSISALCLPGHKGLYGPQGIGLVALAEGVLPETLIEGGNGVDSLRFEMSEEVPERYEAGTLPTPAIAGLEAGIGLVRTMGTDAIDAHVRQIFCRAREAISSFAETEIYLPHREGAVLSFNWGNRPSEEVVAHLNRYGICARGGYHCAALAHRTLGTDGRGAVRLSFGLGNRLSEVDSLWIALRALRET